MRLLTLVLVVLAVAPSGAAALTPEQRLAIVLPTARAVWPTSRCLGAEHITLARIDAPSDIPGTVVSGFNALGTCDITIDPALPLVSMCSLLIHELGHAARGDDWHSSNPKSIMYPVVHDDSRCVRLWLKRQTASTRPSTRS